MPSIKQIEAFYWSGKLGSFVAAARHLNTTQSNISKRIQEIEDRLQLPLFDRSKRSIRLTLQGQNLMGLSERLLKLHGEISTLGSGTAQFSGSFRFGVQEVVAITWLPDLVKSIKDHFPGITPQPEVRGSAVLRDRLRNHEIDLVVGAISHDQDSMFEILPLADLELVWVGSPRLFSNLDGISLEKLFDFPIIGHTKSAPGQHNLEILLRDCKVTPKYVLTCNSLSALTSLVSAGVGLTFLPRAIFYQEIESGLLKIIEVTPPVPPIPYGVIINKDEISSLPKIVAELAKGCCDFSKRLKHY